jgi:hypothetical protein
MVAGTNFRGILAVNAPDCAKLACVIGRLRAEGWRIIGTLRGVTFVY